MKRILVILAIASVIFGSFGMIYCLRFLFSPKLEDLVGAGFSFVGSSILFSAGLICLAFLNQERKNNL